MNPHHHQPYSGYGGPPPPRGDYGGPSHIPPPSMAGPPSGYGAEAYGSPPAPHAYAQQGPPPPMHHHHAPPNPYGRDRPEMYGAPPPQAMNNQPPLPHRDQHAQGAPGMPMGSSGSFSGHVPSYGPPIHFNNRPPVQHSSGPEVDHYRAMPSGPQKRPYDSHDSSPGYGEFAQQPQPGPPARYPPSYGNAAPNGEWQGDGEAHQQPRKRSRAGNEGGGEEDNYSDYLQERLARERPCRTLFVRNIDFMTDVADLRARFESFGEIKTWFDLVKKRGLAFITYYDLRAAEMARNALQGARISGRELDVHFSLPRESEMSKRCDRDKDQGTLFLVLKKAPDDLNDEEIRNLFAPFGEIKNLRPYKDQPNCRFIEFWDTRPTKEAHDAIINTEYRGGTWDIKFAWDQGVAERLPDMAKHDRDRDRLNKMGYRHGEGRGGAPRGGGGGGGGGRERGGPRGGSNDRDNGYGGGFGGPSHEQPAMRRWGQPQQTRPDPAAGYGPMAGAGSPPGRGGSAGYGTPPLASGPQSSSGAYGQAHVRAPPPPSAPRHQGATPQGGAQSPPGAGGPAGDANRLEQAQKVQQLLASLKPGGSGAPTPSSTTAARSANGGGVGQGSGNGAAGGGTAPAGLPSNLAALLQMAQSKVGPK